MRRRRMRDAAELRAKPGLAKARELPVLVRRERVAFQTADYRWRQMFESADVMSEGATRKEPEGDRYYGTSSILLPIVSCGGMIPDDVLDALRGTVAFDPHARLRAVRIACREAQVRATSTLGRIRAELFVRDDAAGVRIDVEVEAAIRAPAAARARQANSDELGAGARTRKRRANSR